MRIWACVGLYSLIFAVLLTNAAFSNNSVDDSADKNKTHARWISAIGRDNTQVLNEILQGSEPSDKALLTVTASNGKTALMVACKQGDEALAKALVKRGANIRAKTITDGTAFMFAVLGDQQTLAEWLRTLGADIDAKGSNGWTSVMIAAAKGLDDTLAWLIDAGANSHTPDVYGFTPLMRAVDNNHTVSVTQLLNVNKVDVHWQDEVANTALHYAVSNQNFDNVQQLLSAGANPLVENISGDTPWSLAQANSADTGNSESTEKLSMQIKSALQENLESR